MRRRTALDLLRQVASFSIAAVISFACSDGTSPNENNPVPVLTSTDPATVIVSEMPSTVTLIGEGFVRESRVRWNDEDRPTTFVSGTALRVTLSPSDVQNVGYGTLTVYSPPPGGGTSGVLHLSMTNPPPVISAVAPTAAEMGGEAFTLTVNGSSFVPGASIRWGTQWVYTTRVSATRLEGTIPASMLAAGGTVAITVVNPAPGGGVSAPVQFPVKLPVPVVTGLAPDTAYTDIPFTLKVLGSKFGAGAVVRWNGSDRATTVVNSSQLTVQVPQSDLTAPGKVTISVANPAPGGGASESLTLTIRDVPPRIDLLSPSTGAAGGAAFTLTISGTDFTAASRVQWNGEDRPTTFVNATTLTASISATDIAAAGTAQVTVVNPGTSGASVPMAFPILTPGAGITSKIVVPLATRHLVADPVRQMLYASVPSSSAQYGNHVVAIDPTTGDVVWSVLVGSEPGRMAIADDGSRLYVILNGAPKVARIDIASHTRDLEFDLGQGLFGPSQGEDIEVLPGQSATVAVSLRNTCCSPRHEGVALYDNGVRREKSTQGHTGSDRITVSGSATKLYGYNNETTEFGFRSILVTDDGLVEETVRGGIISGFGVDIEFSGGRVYATNGVVVDPVAMVRVGTIPASGIVRPDAVNGRVHFLANGVITVAHYSAFTTLGTLAVSEASGGTALVRWGSDGLAVGGGAQVVILRSPLVGP